MGSVRRVYVEKKEGFALEADAVRQDIVKNLGITELTGLRILNRYDMEGVDDQPLAAARYTVFAEPQCDIVYDTLPAFDGRVFAVEYLPGQADQRADSREQCICVLTRSNAPSYTPQRCIFCPATFRRADAADNRLYEPGGVKTPSMELPRTLRSLTRSPRA